MPSHQSRPPVGRQTRTHTHTHTRATSAWARFHRLPIAAQVHALSGKGYVYYCFGLVFPGPECEAGETAGKGDRVGPRSRRTGRGARRDSWTRITQRINIALNSLSYCAYGMRFFGHIFLGYNSHPSTLLPGRITVEALSLRLVNRGGPLCARVAAMYASCQSVRNVVWADDIWPTIRSRFQPSTTWFCLNLGIVRRA